MTNAQRKDAIKLLGMLMSNCGSGNDDHAWQKCPRCLAFNQLEARDPFAMKLLVAAVEALNDATPKVMK